MPTYEYICGACGHEFEEFQAMTAKALKKCPQCGKSTLERKIGLGAGVLFKGGGFYETDYRSDSYKKAAEAEKSGSVNGKAGDKSSTDSGGHVHTGSCACGKKPAGECGGSGAASKTGKTKSGSGA